MLADETRGSGIKRPKKSTQTDRQATPRTNPKRHYCQNNPPPPKIQNNAQPQPKLGSLDAGALARLMGALAALKADPEPSFLRAYAAEVYQKLPLFDDR